MRITGLRSWNFGVTDLEASRRFYTELLGADDGPKHQVRGGDVYRVKFGNNSLGLFDASAGPREGVPHHTLDIDGPDDPEQLKRELEDRGITVLEIRPHKDAGYSLYVNDPDGNRLELSKNA